MQAYERFAGNKALDRDSPVVRFTAIRPHSDLRLQGRTEMRRFLELSVLSYRQVDR